jgi:xanthine dehydrogenase accessory factor
MRSIHRQILENLRTGSNLVLATVVRTKGSTPQKPGSSALFGEEGLIAGTVGGGLLEGEVSHIAESVLISGITDWYYFNLDSDQGEEGAICGGEAVVLVDANPGLHIRAFEEMERSLKQRKEGAMITLVSEKSDEGRNAEYFWITGDNNDALQGRLNQVTKEKISGLFSSSSGTGFGEIELQGDEMVFLEKIKPLPHLVIAGAGHIGKALAHLGSLLDFEITVIDDRAKYANMENIPDADQIIVNDVGAALGKLEPGPDTYVVIVTRGHNSDAEALKSCMGSNAAYVGMIGSRHKVAVMRKQFLEEGWATNEQWEKIHTPIGVPIGSKSVQEIAVSISAQLVSIRSQNLNRHVE